MAEKITNIAKNTSYFTLALIMQKVISFTYFTLIARALGPEDLGKYYFAISFATIFSILIDLGQTNVLTREIAKAKNNANDFLRAILGVKIPLSILTALLIVILANLLNYSDLVKNLIYLSTLCVVLDSFTNTFFSVSRGFHNLKYESFASIIFQLIVLATGLTVIKLNLGLNWLIGSLVSASVFSFIYSYLIVAKVWRLNLRPIFSYELFKKVLYITIPFGLYAIFQKIYAYFDTVLLANLAGDYYVGIYQISFKIINALQFLPLAFTASLYPAMSSYWANNRQQLVVTFERAMNYLIIISLPISIGAITLADKVVLIFKSGYSEATLPLQLSIASLLFMFTVYPIGSLLNACDRQKTNTVIMGLTVLLSIILNFILIPKFQAVGASITVLVSSVFMLVLSLAQAKKIIDYRAKKILLVLSKSILASALMVVLVIFLKEHLSIFLIVPAAGLVYFAALFIFKGFSREDILSVYQSFKRKDADIEIEANN